MNGPRAIDPPRGAAAVRLARAVAGLTAAALFAAAGCGRNTVTRPQSTADRVVSLAPSVTEIVCAIGGADRLVGRTSACDFPSDVLAKVPVVGGFGAPSMELLLAAKPTLILDVALSDETTGAKIRNLGLRRERVACGNLDEVPQAIESVGRLLHLDANAQRLAEAMKSRIRALRDAAGRAGPRPRVFVEIWCDPLTTIGSRSFLSELVYLAGGRSIGDDVPKDYFQVSSEWVVARAPDIVLCLYPSPGHSASDKVLAREGWHDVPAVRERRVYDGFDNNMILRPGPRVLESIESLCAAIAGTPSAAPGAPLPAGAR